MPLVSPATTSRDAIVTLIAADMAGGSPSLNPQILVKGVWDVDYDLVELEVGGAQCIVVVSKYELEGGSRGAAVRREFSVDVAVQFKCGPEGPTLTACDPYFALAEAIGAMLFRQKLTTGAVISAVAMPHPFVPAHLQQFRVFSAVVTLTCFYES